MTSILTPVYSEFSAEDFAALDVEQVEKVRSFMKDAPLGNRLSANITVAEDQNGVRYEKVDFIVDARWTHDGKTWVAGGGFAVCVDDLVDGILAQLS